MLFIYITNSLLIIILWKNKKKHKEQKERNDLERTNFYDDLLNVVIMKFK